MVILAWATKFPTEASDKESVHTGALGPGYLSCFCSEAAPFLSTWAADPLQVHDYEGHMVVKCHYLDAAHLQVYPGTERTHTLLPFNLGAVIPIRKQKRATQGMQWLLQEYKHELHWNRLHALYKH